MPQLSIETYMTQYLWLVILLGVFYYYVATRLVPKISIIKKTRSKIATETPVGAEVSAITTHNINLGTTTTYKTKKSGEIGDLFENMNKEWLKK